MAKRKRRQKQAVTAYVYDKRGRLVSLGVNSYTRTHPLQAAYGRRTGRPNAVFLHAELDALLKSRGRDAHRIVVVRINKQGEPCLAAPCPACALAIAEWGVTEIEHT